MATNSPSNPDSPVPGGRLSRLARLGSMATGVAGSMLMEGARQWAQGKRPRLSDLLLTPANAVRVTQQLAQMRGAAMKVGQLISMDGGDLLPPELASILARLRSDARAMPARQVQAVLTANWGAKWQQRFEPFSFTPIAAASIGQVHRARTKDGRDLAIKIQYPGVRKSISSDVDNVASLLRMSGLLPKTLNITPLLQQAKSQLREEADYQAEAAHLQHFGQLLADAPEFLVPELHPDLSTKNVLAMTFVDGLPVESMVQAPQPERDRIVRLLVGLLFRELFEFGLMQTDPNFANYR
ncbi:MAG: ABC1 kinase family protein, partial [Rhodoferax sp.]